MPGLRELASCSNHGLLALSGGEQMVRWLITHFLEGNGDTCHKGPRSQRQERPRQGWQTTLKQAARASVSAKADHPE